MSLVTPRPSGAPQPAEVAPYPSQRQLTVRVSHALDTMPVGRVHRKVVVAVGLGLFFDMYEVFLAGTMAIALGQDFKLSGNQLKTLLASAFVGMFLGSALLGRLADRIGRRRAFLWNLLWYSAWSLVGAFAPNAWLLVGARFMAGIGVGAEYPVADAYLSDVLPKASRGRMATWAYTSSFVAVPVVGFLALALNHTHPLGIAGWRWLLALGAVGAVAVLWLRRDLPESPRWLNSVGRHEEALAATKVFAEGAGVTMDERAQVPDEPVEAVHHVPSDSHEEAADLARLAHAPYAARLGMLAVFHLFQPFGYYAFATLGATVLLARGHSVAGSLLFTAMSFLGYPIGSLLSTPLVNRVERKYLVLGSLVALAASGLVFATADANWMIVLFGFATTAFSNVFSNAYHVYQAEIFPTDLRATAVGWTYSLSRLSSGALPFVLVPVLHRQGASAMFTVVAVALAIVFLAVALVGPRTGGRSLGELNPS